MRRFISKHKSTFLGAILAVIVCVVSMPVGMGGNLFAYANSDSNVQLEEAGLYDVAGTKLMVLTQENVGPGYRNVKTFIESNPTTVKVVLPYGQKHLNTHAFENCTTLEVILIPESVESIGLNVFEGCTRLEEVSIPNNLVEIDNYAFKDCISLKEFDLQNRVSIGQYTFMNCVSLETVKGSNIASIGNAAFSDCKKLANIDLSNVENIGWGAFQRCSSLTNVALPEAVQIGSHAFMGCTSLESLSAPKVTTIKNYTFANCYNLKMVSLPNAIEIGEKAFDHCESLENTKANLFSFDNAGELFSGISKSNYAPTYLTKTSSDYGYKDVENGYFVSTSSSSSRYVITDGMELPLAPGSYKFSAEVYIPSGNTDKTKVYFGVSTLPSNADYGYAYDIKEQDKWVKLEMAFIVKEGDTATYVNPARGYMSAFPVYMRNVEVTEIVPETKEDLRGYKWVTIGDSVTQKSDASTLIYHDYVAFETGVEVLNMATGGAGYKALEDKNAAYHQKALSVPADTDVITILGSGTDLTDSIWKDLGLGNPTDTGVDTICGCINTTIDNVFATNPNVKLGIITPTPWQKYNQTTEDNSVGNRMNLYSHALIEICELRGIPYLDLYHNSGLMPWDSEVAKVQFADANAPKHPTEYGHSLIAPMIQEFIISLLED